MHALLAHLADRGFTGAPRPLGFDEQGREVLTFLENAAWHQVRLTGFCDWDFTGPSPDAATAVPAVRPKPPRVHH